MSTTCASQGGQQGEMRNAGMSGAEKAVYALAAAVWAARTVAGTASF